MISTAFIDGPYRYRLTRSWGLGNREIAWVMLNPSTADETLDDATIRRCIGFSKKWGFDGIRVANLFAFRSTDPSELKNAPDPIGPRNDNEIIKVCEGVEKVICAWGSHGDFLSRGSDVLGLLSGFPTHHLGLTNGGQPKHPLYLHAETTPTPFKDPTPSAKGGEL